MSLAECWWWFDFAGMKARGDQELRRLCWRVAEQRFGVQKTTYTQRHAYKVCELFRVVNGRPNSETGWSVLLNGVLIAGDMCGESELRWFWSGDCGSWWLCWIPGSIFMQTKLKLSYKSGCTLYAQTATSEVMSGYNRDKKQEILQTNRDYILIIYILWLYIDIWKMNKICYFFCYSKAEFSAVISALFSVTWSFRNYHNMLLCCLRDNSYYIHYYNQCQNSFVLFSGLFVERTAEIKSFWNTDNVFPVSFEWLCLTMALSCYKFTAKHSLYN